MRIPILIGFREVLELGEKYEKEHPGSLSATWKAAKRMMSARLSTPREPPVRNPREPSTPMEPLRAGAEYHLRLDPWNEDDNMCALPATRLDQRAVAFNRMSPSFGSTLNFAEGPETQERDAREIGPTIVFRGARLWESQAAMVRARISSAGLINRFAFECSCLRQPDGRSGTKAEAGRVQEAFLRSGRPSLLLQPIKKSLGLQNARICYTTGTMLSPEAFKFYHALNLPLKSPLRVDRGRSPERRKNEDIRLDTVGPPYQGNGSENIR
jgi:hypothetical protein